MENVFLEPKGFLKDFTNAQKFSDQTRVALILRIPLETPSIVVEVMLATLLVHSFVFFIMFVK